MNPNFAEFLPLLATDADSQCTELQIIFEDFQGCLPFVRFSDIVFALIAALWAHRVSRHDPPQHSPDFQMEAEVVDRLPGGNQFSCHN
jgi:hypothetical protein